VDSTRFGRVLIVGATLAVMIGCSHDKPSSPSSVDKDALKKEAERQKEWHNREMHNR
jgi:hypothetical protein